MFGSNQSCFSSPRDRGLGLETALRPIFCGLGLGLCTAGLGLGLGLGLEVSVKMSVKEL